MTARHIVTIGPDGTPSVTTDPRIIAAADLLAERHQPPALSAAQLCVMLATYERRLRALLDVVGAAPTRRDRFQRLQALEDALRYRRHRIAESCTRCEAIPGGRCQIHRRDAVLISDYERAARQLCAAVSPDCGGGRRAAGCP